MPRKWKFHLGRILLASAACLLLPAAIAFALSGTFKGKTSQGSRVKIAIAGNRVVKKSSFIIWVAHCGKGPGAGSYSDSTSFGGKLKNGTYPKHTYKSSAFFPNAQGVTAEKDKITVSIQFALNGGTAKGTLTAIVRSYNLLHKPPKPTGSCKSGKVTFTAKR